MSKPTFLNKGWWWQAFHERDGWASTTKSQRNIAFALATVIISFYVFSGIPIPTGLPELLAMYFGIAVGGRIADRWVEQKENKDGSSSSGDSTAVGG